MSLAGARVTLVSQWGRFAIQIAGFILLARVLDPRDFGLVAMVASLVVVAGLIADFGLNLAGIQAHSLTQGQKSGLLYANLVLGAIAAIAVAASGPLLASFYAEERLVALAVGLAVPLILGAASVQFRVELTRAGRYAALAMQDVVSAACGLIAAVAAALLGAGYWAIALQTIVQSIILLVAAITQARWMPGRAAPWSDLKALVGFGSNNAVLNVANLISTTVDVAAVGRAQGPTVLGLYSRSNQLVSMVVLQLVAPLTRVVLPQLSRAEGPAAFNAALQRMQHVIVWALLAVVSLLAAVAPPAVVAVFGADWAGMGDIVRILCVGTALQSLGYIYYWALLARARTTLLLVSELPGRAVMIVGAVLLAPFGAEAVAWAMSAGLAVIFGLSTIVVSRAEIERGPLLQMAVRPIAVLALAFGAGALAAAPLATMVWLGTFVGVAAWGAAFGICLLVPAVRADLFAALRSVKA